MEQVKPVDIEYDLFGWQFFMLLLQTSIAAK